MSPMADPVSAMFTEEWDRFKTGVRQLDPDQWRRLMDAQGRRGPDPTQPRSINIPGWDDVFKIGPRYDPTPQERDEYYLARREHRDPQISDQARAALDQSIAVRERIRTSAQPEWQRGWGSILTALDNVQDFASTVSTFGRLALWAAPRVGARFVPGLGWVLAASDLINLLSLVGMLATPAYGLLCAGPFAALAAGLPTMLFKRGLKSEVWNAARRNPFGRAARAANRTKILTRLPGFGAFLEVAQTTQQLFGYGLSFGGVVGVLNEAAAAAEIAARGGQVTVNPGVFGQLYQFLARDPLRVLSTPDLVVQHQAARVMSTAPLVQQYQDLFTTEEHLATLVTTFAAATVTRDLLRRFDWQDAFELALRDAVPPPVALSATTAAGLLADGIALPHPPAWPIPGAPQAPTAGDVLTLLAPRVAAATGDFIRRRRDTAESVFAGTLVGMTTDALWTTLTGDANGLRWELAPDFRLLAGLAEDGYLLNASDGAAKLWPLWTAARARLADLDATSLPLTDWQALAQQHGVTLVKTLPPNAPWPPEWAGAQSPA